MIARSSLATAMFTLATLATAQTPAPKKINQFGANLDTITSPAMRDAVERMEKAGLVEGRRGSLTFFRWADGSTPRLAHLGLWGAKIDNSILALAPALPDLEHISIYETNVDDRGIAALAKLTKLRTVSILPITRYEKKGFGPPQWSYPFLASRDSRPRVTGEALKLLAPLKSLERLDLLDARVSSADLAALSQWPRLSSLSLPGPVDAEAVKHLQGCGKLTTFTLGYRDIAADELKSLAGWKSLRRLTLVHAGLANDALQALAKLETLEELHLLDCGLTDDRLAHLRTPPSLGYLALERNEIDGPGVKHLAKLNLKKLGLEFNNISDATLPDLLQLTTVENLALSYCRAVTDKGIQSGQLQKMTHLKQLGLRGLSQVTDESLDALIQLRHLEHITIRETKISAAGVERMKKEMPKTTVFK